MLLLTTLIAPAVAAAGADQGSSAVSIQEQLRSIDAVALRNATVSSTQFPAVNAFVSRPNRTAITDSGTIGWINQDSTDWYMIGASTIDVYFFGLNNYIYGVSASPFTLYYDWKGTGTRLADTSNGAFSADANLYVCNANTQFSSYPAGIQGPIFSTLADALASFNSFIAGSSDAVLIEPSDSYEWCTGFSLTNSGSSAIAGGWVGNNFYLATYTAGYSISNSQTSVNFALFDQSTDLYYSIIPLQGQESDRIGPVFDTASDFFASAVVVLDDSPTPAPTPTPGTNTFQVPNGYVAYLHLADPTAEIKLTAHFNRPSMLVGDGSGSAWPNSQTYRFGAYLPIEPTQYPVSGSSYIRWFKAAGNQNVFGQTLDGVATLTGGSNLIEIYNPATQSFQLDSQQIYDNPTIFGETTGGILSCVKYELTDNITAGGSITSGFTGGEPVPDPDENDGDGNFINPSTNPGGGTDPVSGNSLQDILNNFFNRFLGLFTEGYQAIRNLTQSSSQFVSRLSELYSWLPSEILTVLTSAIILAIIIGVLKVFL